LALALAAAGGTGAVASITGYELANRYERTVPGTESTTLVVDSMRAPYTAAPVTGVVPFAAAAASGGNPNPLPDESKTNERSLLGAARSAVADGDFAEALVPIGEHARRFESGLLAEEREALRVKALSGLGQAEEARRVAAAFEQRFPNSVLRRSVRQMATSKP
jgi:hypothetical protein